MTTNGLLLDVLAAPLKEAGLDRVNVRWIRCSGIVSRR